MDALLINKEANEHISFRPKKIKYVHGINLKSIEKLSHNSNDNHFPFLPPVHIVKKDSVSS